jgi:hypothetical protein
MRRNAVAGSEPAPGRAFAARLIYGMGVWYIMR